MSRSSSPRASGAPIGCFRNPAHIVFVAREAAHAVQLPGQAGQPLQPGEGLQQERVALARCHAGHAQQAHGAIGAGGAAGGRCKQASRRL